MSKRSYSRGLKTVVVLLFLGIGCGTSNTEGWAITSPTSGQKFTFVGQNLDISVSGTCTAAGSVNQVGAIDPNTNQLLGTSATVTSAANGSSPYSWSGTITLEQMPPNTPVRATATVAICTGQPTPSISGINVPKYSRQDIKVTFSPGY
jgi:hypothetical protein